MPELLNMGIRYQLKQAQIGVGFGFFPIPDESIISVSVDASYHFGGSSKLSERRPVYGRVGLKYLRSETETFLDKYLYLDTRVGRDFNISENLVINADVGAIFELFHDRTEKKPPGFWFLDLDFKVLPSFGIGLFYRL